MATTVSQSQVYLSKARTALTSRLAPVAILFAGLIVSNHKNLPYILGLSSAKYTDLDRYAFWTLTANYMNAGFVRRGLAPSIFALLNHGSAAAESIIFGLVCAAWLALPVGILLVKVFHTSRTLSNFLAFVLLISPQLLRFWGDDIPHSDMLICGFIAWSLLATLEKHYTIAAVTLLVGSLNHEAVLIMGVPLCAAFWFMDWRNRDTRLVNGVVALGSLLFGVAAIALLQHLFSATPSAIARTIVNAPTPDHSEWLTSDGVRWQTVAAYMTAGGLRTLSSSHCMMYSYPGAYLFPLSCIGTLALYALVFRLGSRLELSVFCFVSFLPFAFLSVIAIDYGRWLAFAVMNGWLATAGLAIRGWTPAHSSRARNIVALLVLVILVGLGTTTVFASGNRIKKLAVKFYGPETASPTVFLSKCDPGWLRVAHGDFSK